MKVRVLAVLFGVCALSLVGAFALSFGTGTATAVTGFDVTAECHGWPGQSKVHWDAEFWKATGEGKVVRVSMEWTGTFDWFPTTRDAQLDGETAHHITPVFADQLVATVYFANGFQVHRSAWCGSLA